MMAGAGEGDVKNERNSGVLEYIGTSGYSCFVRMARLDVCHLSFATDERKGEVKIMLTHAEIVDAVKKASEQFPLTKAAYFGSYADGCARPGGK